jgi:hypothetical protein
MEWVGWQPVIVVLETALLALIPALTLYLKSWLNKQTTALSQTLLSSQTATQSALQERTDLTRQLVEKMHDNDLRITIATEQKTTPPIETLPPLEGVTPSGSESHPSVNPAT